MQAIRYTNVDPPTNYIDRFHEVRQMQDIWNSHMEEEYDPSWISCLDESMIEWLNKWCPGWMCVPRKPHPFGNEYHSIADIDDGAPVMWRVELREGKDRPSEMGAKEHDEKGKTVGLMIR